MSHSASAVAEDAEDIVSDVFLKVLGSRRGFSKDIRPLLFTSAKHLIIDYYRTRARRSHVQSHPEMEELIDPASVAALSANTHDLLLGLNKLTADQYMVIFLRFIERYSIQETSVIMKKRPGSIKALQFRALAVAAILSEGGEASMSSGKLDPEKLNRLLDELSSQDSPSEVLQ